MINPLKLSLSVLLLSSSLSWASSPNGIWGGSNSLTERLAPKEAVALLKNLKTLIERTVQGPPDSFQTYDSILGEGTKRSPMYVTLHAIRWATTMPVEKRLKGKTPAVKASLGMDVTHAEDALSATIEPVYKGRKMVDARVVAATPNEFLRKKMPTCISSNSFFRGFIRRVINFSVRPR